MKEGWEIKRLVEVCEQITDGSHFSPKSSNKGEYPYITVRDIDEDIIDFTKCKFISKTDYLSLHKNGCKPNSGDLLFSKDGTVGKVSLVDFEKDFVVLSSLAIIRPKKKIIDSSFLKYILKNPAFLQIAIGKKTGVAIRRIILKNLKDIEISFPISLNEQQRVVSILDEAFAAIDQAKDNVRRNLQNAKELFQSELNSIFKGATGNWDEKKLGDSAIIKIIDGDRGINYPKKEDFFNSGYCVFMNTGNVRPGGFVFSEVMFITKEKDEKLRKGKLSRNDVVMTTRGTIGNLGIYDDNVPFEHIRINSGMLIFRPNLNYVHPKYLFEILRSNIIIEQIKKHVSGAAQPQLPINTLVNFTFPLPTDIGTQQNIVNKLHSLSIETKKLEEKYQQKLNALDDLKKSILDKAFKGELKDKVVPV